MDYTIMGSIIQDANSENTQEEAEGSQAPEIIVPPSVCYILLFKLYCLAKVIHNISAATTNEYLC